MELVSRHISGSLAGEGWSQGTHFWRPGQRNLQGWSQGTYFRRPGRRIRRTHFWRPAGATLGPVSEDAFLAAWPAQISGGLAGATYGRFRATHFTRPGGLNLWPFSCEAGPGYSSVDAAAFDFLAWCLWPAYGVLGFAGAGRADLG